MKRTLSTALLGGVWLSVAHSAALAQPYYDIEQYYLAPYYNPHLNQHPYPRSYHPYPPPPDRRLQYDIEDLEDRLARDEQLRRLQQQRRSR